LEIVFGIIISVLSLAGAGFFYMVLYLGTKLEQENVTIKRILFGLMFLFTKFSLLFTLFLVFTKRKEINLLLFLSAYALTMTFGLICGWIINKIMSTKKIVN
jgi:hypothetical protein